MCFRVVKKKKQKKKQKKQKKHVYFFVSGMVMLNHRFLEKSFVFYKQKNTQKKRKIVHYITSLPNNL